MNRKTKLFLLLGIILLSKTLLSVEERNPVPFYHLNEKPLNLKINLKENKLCRVKLTDVVEYKNIQIVDCYSINKKINETLKQIQAKNTKKNELNLMFIDADRKIINPELQVSDRVYTIKSLLYFKKNKNHYIEVVDTTNGYYYYTYDPLNIVVGE